MYSYIFQPCDVPPPQMSEFPLCYRFCALVSQSLGPFIVHENEATQALPPRQFIECSVILHIVKLSRKACGPPGQLNHHQELRTIANNHYPLNFYDHKHQAPTTSSTRCWPTPGPRQHQYRYTKSNNCFRHNACACRLTQPIPPLPLITAPTSNGKHRQMKTTKSKHSTKRSS